MDHADDELYLPLPSPIINNLDICSFMTKYLTGLRTETSYVKKAFLPITARNETTTWKSF